MGRRQDMGRGPGTGSPRDGWPQPARPRGRWAGLAVGLGAIVLVVVPLVVAAGSVDAEIDFSRIGKGAIKVSDDRRTAVITLPHPALGKVRIDPDRSYVASRDRGILDRLSSVVSDDPNGQRELYRLAEQTRAVTGPRAAAPPGTRERAGNGTRCRRGRRRTARRCARPRDRPAPRRRRPRRGRGGTRPSCRRPGRSRAWSAARRRGRRPSAPGRARASAATPRRGAGRWTGRQAA